VAYNPNILRDLLRARSLSKSALSERLSIKVEDLDRELGQEPEPKQSFLNNIAKELALPPFVFYMKETPPLNDVIPDFRSAKPGPSAKSKSTTESIQFAIAVQNAAAELIGTGVSNLPRFGAASRREIEALALQARNYFKISLNDQLQAADARAFYNICRKRIEERGIFVLHDTFPENEGSGFCLAHPKHPVIVVNTKKQTRGRRLFTLIHELGHVLIHKSGISDPFVKHNATETLCNQFASSFLVPEDYVNALLAGASVPSEPSLEDVARISRRLKISQEAVVVRLEQLQLFKIESHERWLTAIHNVGNPDFTEKGGGANGPPPQEKIKLAKYGFRFAAVFGSALRRGLVTEINLFRATGLKPKYQLPYFDYAKSITDNELRKLELEDD
jgi:Zn-dependent peptidase ImmA (M78 family)